MKKGIIMILMSLTLLLGVSAHYGGSPNDSATSEVSQTVYQPEQTLSPNNLDQVFESTFTFYANDVLMGYCYEDVTDVERPAGTAISYIYIETATGNVLQPIELVHDYGGTYTTRNV